MGEDKNELFDKNLDRREALVCSFIILLSFALIFTLVVIFAELPQWILFIIFGVLFIYFVTWRFLNYSLQMKGAELKEEIEKENEEIKANEENVISEIFEETIEDEFTFPKPIPKRNKWERILPITGIALMLSSFVMSFFAKLVEGWWFNVLRAALFIIGCILILIWSFAFYRGMKSENEGKPKDIFEQYDFDIFNKH